jgi:hypothetical protein
MVMPFSAALKISHFILRLVEVQLNITEQDTTETEHHQDTTTGGTTRPQLRI